VGEDDQVRHVDDQERRARLGVRHALAASARVGSPEQVVAAMTVLHATEPATVHLSVQARAPGVTTIDVERALHDDRTVVKQLAMRRTLFVFPPDLLPAAWGSASARVAEFECRRIAKDAVLAGLAPEGGGADWLETARDRVLAVVEQHPEGVGAAAVRDALPELTGAVEVSAGSSWNHTRVLTHLGLTGHLVRGRNEGHWRISRPRWTTMRRWLGDVPPALSESEGYAVLVSRWLRTFGPGTVEDVQWWLGGTKGAVRATLADLAAVEVSLDGDTRGWVLPDDIEPVAAPERWAALLPVLDPTVMGWRGRDFYVGDHAPLLFDANGNAGTTAWVDGRVVGAWVQDAEGAVDVRLLEDVDAEGRALLLAERDRLDRWLDGERVGTIYPSVAMKQPDVGNPL